MKETEIESLTKRSGFSKRISWGAIFAGVVVVLIAELTLSVLGLAFGAGSIDPLQDKHPLSGLGLGSTIWFGCTTILALFAGGWVSARLSTMPDRTEAALHGVVTWGLSTLALAYLVTSTLGGVLSGAAGILGKTASLVGQGAKQIVPEIAEVVGAEFGNDGISWNEVKKEAEDLLRQSKKPALQPTAIKTAANGIAKETKSAIGDIAKAPESTDGALSELWNRIEARGNKILDAVDQQAIVNVLVARTNLTKDQAQSTVAKWQKTLDDAKNKITALKANAEHKLRKAADSTAETVSKAASWSFVGLLLGLIAATVGGYLGAPVKDGSFIFRRRVVIPHGAAA